VDWKDLDRLRAPGFTYGRRGYDRHEVDRFLEQLVDWLETDAAHDIGQVAVTRKLELVGKSTARILLATEEEAEALRHQAKEDLAELQAQADAQALEVREAADEYAAHVRAGADDDARQKREEATEEASQTIEEGQRRRAQIDEEIKELEAQRDSALEKLERLRAELAAMMDSHRSVAPSSQGTLT
jgi:DivIVA domain-containing protein